jgi:hypothetical protein
MGYFLGMSRKNSLELIELPSTIFGESMDHLHYRLNFDLDKNFITA